MILRTGARAACIGASIVLALASAASAGEKVFEPPGKAGATEYSETLPTSGGNVSTPDPTVYTPPAQAGAGAPIAKLGAGVKGLRADAKLGSTGDKAAGFALSTAPSPVKPPPRPAGSGQTTVSPSPLSDSGSAAGAVAHLLVGAGTGGIGLLLPLALAFTLGLACGVGALRMLRPERA